MSESLLQFVRQSVCLSVRSSVRPSRRRARCLLFARLSSSAACLHTAGTLAPEPVPPLSLLHRTEEHTGAPGLLSHLCKLPAHDPSHLRSSALLFPSVGLTSSRLLSASLGSFPRGLQSLPPGFTAAVSDFSL